MAAEIQKSNAGGTIHGVTLEALANCRVLCPNLDTSKVIGFDESPNLGRSPIMSRRVGLLIMAQHLSGCPRSPSSSVQANPVEHDRQSV